MDEYPDEIEEFELMYGDELDLMREREDDNESNNIPKSRKSLNFQHVNQKSTTSNNVQSVTQDICFDDDFTPIQNSTIQTTQTTNHVQVTNNANKRTINDLFGNIDDMLYEDMLPCPKKLKTEDEQKKKDLALIELILDTRKMRKEENERGHVFDENYRRKRIYDSKYNLSYNIPNYSFIPLTRYDSKRIYVRYHSDLYDKEDQEAFIKTVSGKGFMINSFENVWKEATDYLHTINERRDTETISQNDVTILGNSLNEITNLWVDLYRPKRYMELLSDEATNKVLLKWLKLWDKLVFNKKPKEKPFLQQNVNKKDFYNRFKKQELITTLDEFGRPQHKVALLCGPPGLGKTTLAHIVAKHAGYNVVEVNASDERNVDSFKKILQTATQMSSVVDKEKRPNCIVFDEIDGAPTPAIDFLIKFINGEHVPKSKKNKNQKPNILKRPIICICNDLYVPALRSLRKVAFVINFPPTAALRLAQRLCQIAKYQNIKTDMCAMLALSEKAENDIRTCLSVLHFYKAQNEKLSVSDIQQSSIGQKDVTKGLFAVWQDIFKINDALLKTRMSKILKTVCSFGDYERLMQGIFENFPVTTARTSKIINVTEALDWFCYFDIINNQVQTTQNYDVAPYLPYCFVGWHFALAAKSNPVLKYPNAGYQDRMMAQKNQGIVSEVLNGMQPSVGVYQDYLSLILDVLPSLSQLIVPSFRAINEHLHSYKEKEDLKRIVNLMVDYNITYIQERNSDGVYGYNIEPNIDNVIYFMGFKSQTYISYVNKQIIAREVEMEKMRRLELFKHRNLDNRIKENMKKCLEAVKPNTDRVYKDFFGRIVDRPQNKNSYTYLTRDIWFQYKEGYSNAVRKQIKMSSLK